MKLEALAPHSRAFFALLWIVSCGGRLETEDLRESNPVADGPPVHDADRVAAPGRVHPSPIPPRSSTAPTEDCNDVTLGSSVPSAGGKQVHVISDVTLDFCAALDPATVTVAHVALLAPHATSGILATVSYDGHRRIVIHPTLPLATNSTYRVKTTGLLSRSGQAVGDASFSFSTVRNPSVRRESFAYPGLTNGGALSYVAVWKVDPAGRAVQQGGLLPGADKQYGTPDDQTWWGGIENVYADAATSSYVRKSWDVGADLMFGTQDDVLMGVLTWEDDPEAPYVRSRTRTKGPDGLFFTDDDGYSALYEGRFAEDGSYGDVEYAKDAGPDGKPFTSDDTLISRSVVIATPGMKRSFDYRGAGPDGVWRTADDVLSSIVETTLDSFGRPVTSLLRLRGPDGIFFTDDDTFSGGATWKYDPTTLLLVESRHIADAGPDGKWLTADDNVYQAYSSSYDAEGSLVLWSGRNAGPDRLYDTPDDVVFDQVHYVPQY